MELVSVDPLGLRVDIVVANSLGVFRLFDLHKKKYITGSGSGGYNLILNITSR
jgi:hypothetical protein